MISRGSIQSSTDPRWASWNLGVFLCIRCSGIHRGMGTHISKVKSVDLDVWTPEQMASIQKWGNRLANLYWEAHLKPGHIPPDHKMESFIRSKYESRRWALEGPPPPDPSLLDGDATTATVPESTPAPAAASPQTATPWSGPPAPRVSSPTVTSQPQARQLLSTRHNHAPPAQQTAAAAASPPAASKPQDDLFSLDFRSPPVGASQSSSPPPAKNAKEDILSLFSAAPAATVPASSHVAQPFGQFQQASPWGAAAPIQPQAQPQSMMGSNGTGMWGASSGWAPSQQQQQPNVWGAPVQQQPVQPSLFDTGNVWAASPGSAAPPAQQQKPDDAFGDLWGSFK
ncbi:unnamed protein product [Mycena citricolor]|uniref:Arf-GAP domain-containing protein n=1 Tax=Mycena citricolor TaxID=2018698 RepID=A0AAD2GXU5_9AGAR|nr:unnamed protein product [Mycena citricolor]